MIYLDNAATTRPCPEALAAFAEAPALNPSSQHALGREAAARLEKARAAVARALGARPETVVFTSGGTEANNLALFGATAGSRRRHVVVTALEHASVRAGAQRLAGRGFSVTTVAPRADGRIHTGDVLAALRDDTALVSCIMVCNETGAVNPAGELADAVKAVRSDVLVHSDAVQAFLHVPFSPGSIDLLSISAHKIHGVAGAGALYKAPNVRLAPLLYGGAQEGGLRAGTEACCVISAFAAAAEAFRPPDPAVKAHALETLPGLPGLSVIPTPDAPHIVAFALRGCPGEVAARMLSDLGICVSTGAACSRGKKSAVAASLGLAPGLADSILRISFSFETTTADIDALRGALGQVAARFA